jgi:hypothetical protein
VTPAGVRTTLLGLAAVAMLTACELGTTTIPKTAPSLVVHAVINPNFTSQVVLLERTLTGTITIPDTGFNGNDPIVSAGGIPVSGAAVDILDSSGRVFRGVEDRTLPTSNGKGAGVYRVPLSGTSVVLGARYQLRVRTVEGDTLTAFTRVPRPATRSTGGLTRTFNRDHDLLALSWAPTPAARSYTVRIESPFGPFYLFTDSTHFRANGELRNFFAPDLQRVFIPGFTQPIVIGAVDSNFYDYYRTTNDPFTGSGIISRVTGGLGMFGSLVELNTGTITTVADQAEPIEGRFRLLLSDQNTTNSFASQLTLYIESKPARDGLPTALSGRYNVTLPAPRSDGIVGEMQGNEFTLALVLNQLSGDTTELFIGELRGDTLSGRYKVRGGTAVFVRSP